MLYINQSKYISAVYSQFLKVNTITNCFLCKAYKCIIHSESLDGLFTKLRKSGYGCYIGNTFSGALGYADDVTLIAPSLQSLKQMIKICEEYAKEFDIQFNPSKSKLMCFNNKNSKEFTITINNHVIDKVDNFFTLETILAAT